MSVNASSNFYHIYPLGLCGCPKKNDFCQPAGDGLRRLANELEKIKEGGANSILIGPLFESTSHGYDTVDYFHVDRRLGTNDDLKFFAGKCHSLGMNLVFDAVFNHSGRDFFAFKSVQQDGWNSRYKDWYSNIRFDGRSPFGDNFTYDNWAGCADLVKYNLENPEIQEHLFSAVKMWIDEFGVDGLRLDAADTISFNFMKRLKNVTHEKRGDFWLMGEVVHGDYNRWVNPEMLDSVTNYQLHKGLWSSFNDKNFFEVAYSLNRQFGNSGQNTEKLFYNFVDNHDVNRIASTLKNKNDLFPLYAMLFTIPGIPSIYYGSEMGIQGTRNQSGDVNLRPSLPPFGQIPEFAQPQVDSEKLRSIIKAYSNIREHSPALQYGNYEQVFLSNTEFVFLRHTEEQNALAVFNVNDETKKIRLHNIRQGIYTDTMTGEKLNLHAGAEIEVAAHSARIFIN
ncbi:MAG: alpha-amylase [Treponema sp.]|nr:alpha-amylase [Treponema sp.]